MANRNTQIRNMLDECRYYDSFIRPEYIRNWRYLIPTNDVSNLCMRIAEADILHVPQRRNDEVETLWTRRPRRRPRYNRPENYVEAFVPLNSFKIKYTLNFIILIILLVIIYINAQ